MLRMAERRSARMVLHARPSVRNFSALRLRWVTRKQSNKPSSAVDISPPSASVRAGDTLQFTAKVIGTMNQSAVWSTNGVVGGNATVGKISPTGLYTAPAALPTPDSVSIEASSASDQTISGKTEISLENPIPTVTANSPTAVPVGSFSITLSGTNFVSAILRERSAQATQLGWKHKKPGTGDPLHT